MTSSDPNDLGFTQRGAWSLLGPDLCFLRNGLGIRSGASYRMEEYWKNWGTGHDTTVLRRLSICSMWDNIQSLFEFTLHPDCAPSLVQPIGEMPFVVVTSAHNALCEPRSVNFFRGLVSRSTTRMGCTRRILIPKHVEDRPKCLRAWSQAAWADQMPRR